MTRRRAVLVLAGLPLGAATREEFLDILMRLAAALSAADIGEFFRYFDASYPDAALLRGYVSGLVAAAEITSSVDVRRVDGGTAEADWYMELKGRAPTGPRDRRRALVKLTLNEQRKIVALTPATFFRLGG